MHLRDNLRDQPRFKYHANTLSRTGDRLFEALGAERQQRFHAAAHKLTELRIMQRAVVIVGTQGYDHAYPAVGISDGGVQQRQEMRS